MGPKDAFVLGPADFNTGFYVIGSPTSAQRGRSSSLDLIRSSAPPSGIYPQSIVKVYFYNPENLMSEMTRRPDNGKRRRIYLRADEQGLNMGYTNTSDSSKDKFAGGEEVEGGENDRISQLPEPILQRILCYLSTKEAFRSSTLSKSWRYICWTIPKLELREIFFNGNREAFLFLETTLSRYRDQNISLPEFHLEIISKVDSEFVRTWIPLGGMCVKKFSLDFISDREFHLAATAESLEELHLSGTIEINNHALRLKRFDFLADHLSLSHLKSLHLTNVELTEDSFHRFSVGMCCLEELTLIGCCFGFRELKLASRSIKNLSLHLPSQLRKAAIDVPNVRSVELSCVSLPSISFTAASLASEWNSKIIVQPFPFLARLRNGPSSILIDIYQLHKAALSHSEFSLHITSPFGLLMKNVVDSPVVVENLTMDAKICAFPLGAWLAHLFKIFRPRNIQHFWYANPENDSQRLDNLLVNCLREFLLVKDNNQQGLEQVLVEEEEEADNRKLKIRFRLKWREGSNLVH